MPFLQRTKDSCIALFRSLDHDIPAAARTRPADIIHRNGEDPGFTFPKQVINGIHVLMVIELCKLTAITESFHTPQTLQFPHIPEVLQ